MSAPAISFDVEIPNLKQLQAAMEAYPAIATPIVQGAVVKSQAILARNTNASTVPQRTGLLLRNWGLEVGLLFARWFPKQSYAYWVEVGTKPHIIEAKNASVLATPIKNAPGWGGPVSKAGFAIFGTKVKHPGTKPNPFMERIMDASEKDIVDLFSKAEDQITAAIAASIK